MPMDNTRKNRVLSGMQPTGALHLGHYLGVLSNYVRLQDGNECFYMVADWHAMTAFYSCYKEAQGYIPGLVADWLAAGIDPDKSVIFVQSDVQAHSILQLILSMYTPVSWLLRNPSYKDKIENVEKDIDSAGFLGYPVLQAADILLYQADKVPIGEDQLPHLELTREIARRFNFINQKEVFRIPGELLSSFPKVLGTDGRKMSKSYGNTLPLAGTEADLRQRMKGMKTDTARVRRDDPGNPENCPVFTYYDFFAPERKSEINTECRRAGIGCSDCKKIISDAIVSHLQPFRDARERYSAQAIPEILASGAEKAAKIANETLAEVKDTLGIGDTSLRVLH